MQNNTLYAATLFDSADFDVLEKETEMQEFTATEKYKIDCITTDFEKYKSYNLEKYINDVETFGLAQTWFFICKYVLENGENADFLNIKNFGEMYEIGLAIQDKIQKKNNGQYYTPDDVALIMSKWLFGLQGENVCDVACGTGKLILTYLDLIGEENAQKLIQKGNLYLYDADETALEICKTSILVKYGLELEENLHCVAGDFLSQKIELPKNCKVISNPPYAKIQETGRDWQNTKVLNDSQELYSVFMEKIITQSESSVIITPYSFISGSKFYSLRQILDNFNGEIYSFDNVPGNIFCGRKHGIFNTNTSNSVRAAITVVRSDNSSGFRLTPLIRFKQTERKELLTCKKLESFLPEKNQKITSQKKMFYKCFKELQPLFDCLNEKSNGHTLSEFVSEIGTFIISMPNTCRYYTTAFAGTMNRSGQITLHFSDKDVFNYVFCLINSSFVYWHWRLYDGGINYPRSLLMQVPSIFELLSDDDKKFFEQIANEMIENASQFVITKNNVGIQENVKYPRKYRDKINQRIVQILEIDISNKTFDLIHSNMALEVNV